MKTSRLGYCIFMDTMCEGTVPAVRTDGNKPFVFASRVEAERDLADDMITRLQEFLDGNRDFDDATTLDESIEEVAILEAGSIVDLDGGIIWSPREKLAN